MRITIMRGLKLSLAGTRKRDVIALAGTSKRGRRAKEVAPLKIDIICLLAYCPPGMSTSALYEKLKNRTGSRRWIRTTLKGLKERNVIEESKPGFWKLKATLTAWVFICNKEFFRLYEYPETGETVAFPNIIVESPYHKILKSKYGQKKLTEIWNRTGPHKISLPPFAKKHKTKNRILLLLFDHPDGLSTPEIIKHLKEKFGIKAQRRIKEHLRDLEKRPLSLVIKAQRKYEPTVWKIADDHLDAHTYNWWLRYFDRWGFGAEFLQTEYAKRMKESHKHFINGYVMP